MTQENGQTESSLAVALKYDGENAPKVTAKGSQELAQQRIGYIVINAGAWRRNSRNALSCSGRGYCFCLHAKRKSA